MFLSNSQLVVTFTAYVIVYVISYLTFVAFHNIQGRVKTPIMRGGQCCCHFVEGISISKSKIIKIKWFNKVMAKIKRM